MQFSEMLDWMHITLYACAVHWDFEEQLDQGWATFFYFYTLFTKSYGHINVSLVPIGPQQRRL